MLDGETLRTNLREWPVKNALACFVIVMRFLARKLIKVF